MFNKKGEMTTQQIVILIILIVSFAILLFFIMRLGFGSETSKEICHNSVVTRGSSIIPAEATPLDCQREYICITADRNCDAALTNPIKKKVSTKEELYEVLAKELTDCWWMFGEGKVNYVGDDLVGNLYCSLCSQIAFDSSIKDIVGSDTLSKKEFYEYMARKNMSGSSQTYSEYLFGTNDLDKIFSDANLGEIVLENKQYYSLMGITSEIGSLGWILTGGVAFAVGSGVIISSVGSGGFLIPLWVGAAGVLGGVTGNYVASTIKGDSGNDYLLPSLIEAGSDEFKQLNCDYIVTKS